MGDPDWGGVGRGDEVQTGREMWWDQSLGGAMRCWGWKVERSAAGGHESARR